MQPTLSEGELGWDVIGLSFGSGSVGFIATLRQRDCVELEERVIPVSVVLDQRLDDLAAGYHWYLNYYMMKVQNDHSRGEAVPDMQGGQVIW